MHALKALARARALPAEASGLAESLPCALGKQPSTVCDFRSRNYVRLVRITLLGKDKPRSRVWRVLRPQRSASNQRVCVPHTPPVRAHHAVVASAHLLVVSYVGAPIGDL